MFSSEELEAKVREIAAEKPEHVYQRHEDDDSCLYVEEDAETGEYTKPGCIFGKAFLSLGVSPDRLVTYNRRGISGIMPTLFPEVKSTNEQLSWRSVVQMRQDSGSTWSEAVRIADVLATDE